MEKKVEVYNDNSHFGYGFELQPHEMSILYKEFPKLGIYVGC
jgi:hypothetical protein